MLEVYLVKAAFIHVTLVFLHCCVIQKVGQHDTFQLFCNTVGVRGHRILFVPGVVAPIDLFRSRVKQAQFSSFAYSI